MPTTRSLKTELDTATLWNGAWQCHMARAMIARLLHGPRRHLVPSQSCLGLRWPDGNSLLTIEEREVTVAGRAEWQHSRLWMISRGIGRREVEDERRFTKKPPFYGCLQIWPKVI